MMRAIEAVPYIVAIVFLVIVLSVGSAIDRNFRGDE